ncbi:cytochrome P450 [Aspergillus ustus]|uniref:Cytochrome P450 n=1 Tax=Aspergillus ustus TaxID=40382 RepID=A0A0C1C2Y6_ASPUT|nr:cytochrome P450 [Aspergillus ustus]
MIRHGTTYPVLLGQANDHPPIYAIRMFGQRIYTVSSPDLASIVMRKQRHLDTETQFIITVFQNMLGADKSAMKLLLSSTKPAAKKARTPFREEMRSIEHRLLASGEPMQAFYETMVTDVSQRIGPSGFDNSNTAVPLLKLLEEVLIAAAGTALYGKENPLVANPSLGRDYWLYDSQMSLFLLDFLPRYTVSEAFKARERLVTAFSDYHVHGGQEDMSDIVRGRSEVARRYGCSDDYLGRSEVELLNGLLSNMVPTVFWMLVHILLDAGLAERVSSEVESFVQELDADTLRIAPGEIRTGCPVLVATYQEALRLYSSSARAYQVMEDFMLTDDCLLRKNSIITIPAETIHRNPKNWGPDALEFNVDRWFKPDRTLNSSAWVPFGGGSSICPGRFFVFDMILSTVIVVLHSYDLRTPGTEQPPGRKTRVMSGIRIPADDIDVIAKRKKHGNVRKWVFERKSSKET